MPDDIDYKKLRESTKVALGVVSQIHRMTMDEYRHVLPDIHAIHLTMCTISVPNDADNFGEKLGLLSFRLAKTLLMLSPDDHKRMTSSQTFYRYPLPEPEEKPRRRRRRT